MSAELVDPFATPDPERLKAIDMRADINGRIALSSQNDPPLLPQLLQKTLEALDEATDDESVALAGWARWLMEELHHRAVSGVPWGEAEEPAWAFDRPEPLYRRVLDADDLDPGEG